MDKNKIKKYAINARTELINAIKVKLATLGMDENEIQDKLSISTPDKEYYVDDNEANALTGAQIGWRKDIVAELNRHGYQEDSKTAYKDFVEEVAYTWFNRIIAIRFMEVNNYLPSRVRVLSSEEGRNEPDIINEAMEISDDLGGYSNQEKELITTALTEKTPELMDNLYTMLFIKQCDALSEILPGLFEETSNYLKLLFTPHYDRGVIKELVNEIPEEYFDVKREGQVQIIGWLYQYYNNAPHEEVVNIHGKAIQKDEIPAATQLFTPDWIVRYMVDNSLGKYYLERHPDSIVKHELKYLLPDEIKAINENQDITDYKLLDNAMGSGHILVYAFELFMKMYIEQGYSKRNAAQKIIENNLFGLEIDKRAFQLAYFSIMMKGREYDRRFLRRNPTTNLYYFEDLHVSDEFYNFISDKVVRANLKKVVKDFSDATELGSIIKIDESIDLDSIEEVVAGLDFESGLDVFGYKKIQQQILKTLKIIKVMTTKYEAVVTNPPYMNKFDKTLKKYLKDSYKNYSKDLFSVFIYHNVHQLVKGGYAGYMTPLVWMFIKTYEPLRHDIIDNFKIDSLIQMEYSAFEEATVPIDTFVLKNSDNRIGTYLSLSNFKGGMIVQEQKVLEAISDPTVKYLYHTDQSNFNKIPGSPIAYWISENSFKLFSKEKLGDISQTRLGMATSDNKRFVRFWYEIDLNNIGFDYKNRQAAEESAKKWFPYDKGGEFRKWFGNNYLVVDWEKDGIAVRNFKNKNGKVRSHNYNLDYIFKSGLTWSALTSGNLSIRYTMSGHLFDNAGSKLFTNNSNIFKILGYLGSVVSNYYVSILNPTMNIQPGTISELPYVNNNDIAIDKLVNVNIRLSKSDWDAFETSWDFQKSPLLTQNVASFHQAYDNWSNEALKRFNQLKSNEEELNRIFIDLYGLQDELTPEEDDKEVSVRKADQVRDIKAFLSYFIGCVFGRYSLDQDGLVYAGGDWDDSKYTTFKPNKENIILLTDRQYFDDDRDIIVRLKEFLTKTFDPETLTENMDFIAQTLEPKKFERGTSAEDIIRTYFLNDFYKDHAKIYQKRPIYWEFNSGRNKGFKALMYLHRYNTEQLPMVRHYLHELQPAMNDLIEVDQNLLDQETTASAKSKYRKTIATLNKQMNEIMKYDQILDHLSQSPVNLDLDDGVLVNHEKLQQGEKLLSKL
ncbi:BREX-1 system adenine-specific DNA-methyltransferase PglX [Lactobacillus kefiranofaciens subsp. kefirgranum]|uniref:BREX-1 system adenine-specific DNA-methyltransferase PglX n=1 Tax=Lactobacillus kefiranofaciens TaxID=267818 RepID=UPI0020301558|nr:BREX-1 system adenine-specific DNA-methyltransferase PglX [Lactobacillus kefiranofaciens]URW71683.1 BREX-1 system adenine-specific DNA-methyltransferase PglX [Lactobacillus kefiranofaciens subsp. kefirgranum]URW73631.1 BREX-1 system adenine-specific DNA-methyltransferase PglX [Lactobacillus kefiranofaciens subsp. kefirgranum]